MHIEHLIDKRLIELIDLDDLDRLGLTWLMSLID